MDAALPVVAGMVSTTLFAASTLPMVVKAARTRDMDSYSRGNLVLSNVGNVVHTLYVASLPFGPIWALHGFYLVTTAFMLAWYLRHSGDRGHADDGDRTAARDTDQRTTAPVLARDASGDEAGGPVRPSTGAWRHGEQPREGDHGDRPRDGRHDHGPVVDAVRIAGTFHPNLWTGDPKRLAVLGSGARRARTPPQGPPHEAHRRRRHGTRAGTDRMRGWRRRADLQPDHRHRG